VITCTRCKTALGAETVNTFALIPCPTCNASIRADVYPALFRKLPSGHTGDLVQTEKEAGCSVVFYVHCVMLSLITGICVRCVWRKAKPSARLKIWKTTEYAMTKSLYL
jgi:hypothetical protein